MAEPEVVIYFCPGSCKSLAPEQPRDTGTEYFGPSDAEDDEQLSTALQTDQQQRPSVSKSEGKLDPAKFYTISQKCVPGTQEPVEPQNYYEIDDAEIDNQPNSCDVRVETGYAYFGTGSFVEVIGLVPDEQTILARHLAELEEESEFPSVKYFCTPSTENVHLERQRSTGLSYFGCIDYRSVWYFCPGDCEHMPPEQERDTGRRMFVGSAYEEAVYRVNPIPEFGNLSDIRIISGCHYYGGGRCVEKLRRPESLEAMEGVRYFCPGSCLELPAEKPRDTGLTYFSRPPDYVSSTDSLAAVSDLDEGDEFPTMRYFCTPSCENVPVEMPRDPGKRYFIGGGKPTTTRAAPAAPQDDQPVRPPRYFVGVETDKVDIERPRDTGERKFGPPDRSLDGYDYNLSDLRTVSGCLYYSGEPCIDVVTADRTIKPPKPEKYFCPGICDHMPPETPRDTGLDYFGAAPSPSSSVTESLADDWGAEGFAFNLADVRVKSGYLYFSGKMWEGYPPVRYFCPGSCESLAAEPVKRTGSDYFGSDVVAHVSSRVGFDANLSDVRTETGCKYYGAGPCVEVRGWDRVPRCLSWSCYQVAGWIESLGFSYYRASVQLCDYCNISGHSNLVKAASNPWGKIWTPV